MKDRKKPKGTKARVQAYKKRVTYIGHAIIVVIFIAIIAVSSFFLYSMLYSPPEQKPINPTLQFESENSNSQLKAAIVDHLSLTAPNQTFIETAVNILKQAGYTVDYYSGEKVTVEFYRNLPTHDYSLIVLRVHSGTFSIGTSHMVCFFSSELYTKTKYVLEQLTDQVGDVRFSEEETRYFGISQNFVSMSMRETFKNATIIMMGCEGLAYTTMAEAFIYKGARAYISWNSSISVSHTDQATTNLLQHLILEKQTIKKSVEEAMKEVGPDPACNSLLIYYPLEAGEQTIENIIGEN